MQDGGGSGDIRSRWARSNLQQKRSDILVVNMNSKEEFEMNGKSVSSESVTNGHKQEERDWPNEIKHRREMKEDQCEVMFWANVAQLVLLFAGRGSHVFCHYLNDK